MPLRKRVITAAADRHDLFAIEVLFEQLCVLLEEAGLSLKGLFLNRTGGPADSGFDSQTLRQACQQRESTHSAVYCDVPTKLY